MIECYFRWCDNHCKDEPFCKIGDCTATEQQIIQFEYLRKKDLENWEKERNQ